MYNRTPKKNSFKIQLLMKFLNNKPFNKQAFTKSDNYNEMVNKFYSKLKK